jgi:hypothetical protein
VESTTVIFFDGALSEYFAPITYTSSTQVIAWCPTRSQAGDTLPATIRIAKRSWGQPAWRAMPV